jgi:two-component system, NarL family, response regulator LiaR
MKTVLYSDDVNLLSHWEKSLDKECQTVYELDELYQLTSSVVIINYSACLGNCSEIVSKLNAGENRVLILHRVPLFSTAKELLQLGAYGYGNALMRDHFIVSAVNAIKDGMVWLYPEFTSQLIMEIPQQSQHSVEDETLLDILSPREKDVALLLKDGLTYKNIAEKLDITPRTVKAHAQHVYAKLHVKDRLALALLLK